MLNSSWAFNASKWQRRKSCILAMCFYEWKTARWCEFRTVATTSINERETKKVKLIRQAIRFRFYVTVKCCSLMLSARNNCIFVFALIFAVKSPNGFFHLNFGQTNLVVYSVPFHGTWPRPTADSFCVKCAHAMTIAFWYAVCNVNSNSLAPQYLLLASFLCAAFISRMRH